LFLFILAYRGASMIEKLASDVVDQMIEKGLIEELRREHYIYALVSLLEKSITVGTIILISIGLKKTFPTVFFLIFFLELRKRTGGYHLDSFRKCYVGTVATYIIIVGINSVIIHNMQLLWWILLVSVGVVLMIGTVNHPNMNMSIRELEESKKAARIMVVLESTIIYCFVLLEAEMIYISYMSIAIILCAILICVARLKKQEVKNEDN